MSIITDNYIVRGKITQPPYGMTMKDRGDGYAIFLNKGIDDILNGCLGQCFDCRIDFDTYDIIGVDNPGGEYSIHIKEINIADANKALRKFGTSFEDISIDDVSWDILDTIYRDGSDELSPGDYELLADIMLEEGYTLPEYDNYYVNEVNKLIPEEFNNICPDFSREEVDTILEELKISTTLETMFEDYFNTLLQEFLLESNSDEVAHDIVRDISTKEVDVLERVVENFSEKLGEDSTGARVGIEVQKLDLLRIALGRSIKEAMNKVRYNCYGC